MPTIPTIVLKQDITGISSTNLITLEEHITLVREKRIIKPNFSPFFVAGLMLYSVSATGIETECIRGAQYLCTDVSSSLTRSLGTEVCKSILITDGTLPVNFKITYQALGGDTNVDVTALATIVRDLPSGGKLVDWKDILDKPLGYNPGPHLHDSADLYGFEYLSDVVKTFVNAIESADDSMHALILNEVVVSKSAVLSAFIELLKIIDLHETDLTNPHAVTKTQVGLGLVENRGFIPKVIGGITIEPYSSPRSILNQINATIFESIGNHLLDLDNPHSVTKEQIGLALLQNYSTATIAEMLVGTVTDRYVTPAGVWAVGLLLRSVIDAHSADTTNPHAVTKAQVGLGLVENYSMSSLYEAAQGVATNLYMTPEGVKEALTSFIMSQSKALNLHVSSRENPHSVTKAQVGLGSVDDYPIATDLEAMVGASTSSYITPAGLKAAKVFSEAKQNTIREAHETSSLNPHAVTKAQVGLGSVDNYPVADDVVAKAGSSIAHYVTPAGLKIFNDAELLYKINVTEKGSANGVAPLDQNQQVPLAYLTTSYGNSTNDIHNFINGKPLVREILLQLTVVRAFFCPLNFAGSLAICGVAPTNLSVIEILKSGVGVGTIAYAANSTSGVFQSSGEVVFLKGDILTLRCAATVQDASFSDITLGILGSTFFNNSSTVPTTYIG